MGMDRRERFTRLAGGISVGSINITAGTLSGLFKDLTDGNPVIVSNWHVFRGDPGKTPIVQPGPYDNGKDPDDRIGILKRYVPLDRYGKMPWWKRILCLLFGWLLEEWCLASKEPNYVDCACATFEPYDKNRTIQKGVYLDDGTIIYPKNSHPGDNIVNAKVWKAGRTTGVTTGTVIDDSAKVKVWYGDRYIIFEDQILVQADCKGGDSGSPVFLMKGDKPSGEDAFIGLLFAGGAGFFVACKYKHIKELLKVSWEE
jgi:hypothetical protein